MKLLGLSICLLLLGPSGGLAQDAACRADIALLIDHSGSIVERDPKNWTILKTFLNTILESVDFGESGTKFAAIFFANNANLMFDFTTCASLTCMQSIIKTQREPFGQTNMEAAMNMAMNTLFTSRHGDRPDARNLAIIVTDGKPNPMTRTLEYTAQRMKRRGIRLLGVGITDEVDHDLMRRIVSVPPIYNYFSVKDFTLLSNILDLLIQGACMTLPPMLSTTPAMSTKAPMRCDRGGDIVIVLDSSGSIGSENYKLVKAFVATLIQDLPVEVEDMRVALVTFSTLAKTIFHFNKFNERYLMRQEVDNLPYVGGTTSTAEALRLVHGTVLTSQNGDRHDRSNVVLVLTDGNSNDKKETIEEAIKLKEKAHVIVLQVGDWVDEYELNAIASYPNSTNRIKVDTFDALLGVKDLIQDSLCNNDDNCNDDSCKNNAQCIDGIRSFDCKCTRGYAAPDCSEQCRQPADVIFAIDRSGSIGAHDFQRAIDFAKDVVNGMPFKVHQDNDFRVGLVSFGTKATMHFNLDKYKEKRALQNAMDILYTGGTTNTADALRTIKLQMFLRGRKRYQPNGKAVPRIVIVLTDGRSDDEAATWKEALELRNDGVHIIAVAVGNRPRQSELEAMTTYPSEANVFRVARFTDLGTLTGDILKATCNTVDDCANNPCKNGGTCTDLMGTFSCRCARGFSGPDCSRTCNGKIDLAILLDASGSIRSERFPHVKEFLAHVVKNITVGQDAARVGVVSWSDDARVEFPFDRYDNCQDVISAIRSIKFIGKRTNTQRALDLTRHSLFMESRGDRRDAPDFALIFTDGGSNIQESRTIPEALRLKEKGVHVSIVAVGDDMDAHELQGIVSDPADINIMWSLSFKGLPTMIEKAWRATCNDVNECESNPCQNGATCVDQLQMYTCRCPSDYVGIHCEKRCRRQMDVAFVLDISGSVEIVYDVMVNFTKHATRGLPMHFGRTRIALVTYADTSNVIFDLDDHNNVMEVLNAITVKRPGGATNTQAGLRTMHLDVFSPYRGDRGGVDNVAIVLTDGMSNIQQEFTKAQADRAHDKGIDVYVMAVGQEIDRGEIDDIASDPDSDHVITLPTANDIPKSFDSLLELLCK